MKFTQCLAGTCSAILLSQVSWADSAKPVFESVTIDNAISIGYGLAIGDMDGDGKLDILLADAREFVWYQNPTWKKHVFAKLPQIRDNVCIAAEDIDGDGKVEIAVGANWNPGETSDGAKSGSVHYLQRPAKDDELWAPTDLPHDPTVHRMRWMKFDDRGWALVVLPLHGRENKNGAGDKGVRVQAYFPPKENKGDAAAWKVETLDESMHVTHNLDRLPGNDGTMVVGGKEGLLLVDAKGKTSRFQIADAADSPISPKAFPGVGEIRWFSKANGGALPDLAAIEPFHGNMLATYAATKDPLKVERRILDDTLNQGHALGCGDFLRTGSDQIVAGWREPNAEKHFGIKLYAKNAGGVWEASWVDQDKMACEDLKVADLDGDGRLDIIAAGRATKNVVVYWNKTPGGK